MGRFAKFDWRAAAMSDEEIAPAADQGFRIIIPCGLAKTDGPTIARYLYTGPYFRACLDYALAIAEARSVLILSAKHGLIELGTYLEPYDITFDASGAISKAEIARQAKSRGIQHLPTLILGGEKYCARASYAFPNSICLTDHMGEHRSGIGRQLSWLKKQKGAMPVAFKEILPGQAA